MTLTQDQRAIAVTSSLGKDLLLFRSLGGQEHLGRAFEFVLEVLSRRKDIAAADLLGKPVTVKLTLSNGQNRYFNGYVMTFSQEADDGDLACYRLILRPWLWFLTCSTNCRIFQNQSAPDIIKKVLREYSCNKFEESLSESHRSREYCVQYRESDFNFVSRLMEEEGIYYYFSHADGSHTLHLVDSASAHSPSSGYETIPYFPPENSNRRERDHIYGWSQVNSVQSGSYAMTDYNFKTPKSKLLGTLDLQTDNDFGSLKRFDYPGRYEASGESSLYLKARLQALQSEYQRFAGESNAFGLAVGSSFTLKSHPRADQNAEYLVTGLEFRLDSNQYGSGDETGAYFDEALSIFAIKKSRQFRSAHTTPKPVVRGPQTGVVVGKSGEEIWTDEYGRIKVQFHWDREGASDEKSSCWMRVAQPWAGQGWGAIAIPRIGQEVVIDFLEGDPDRPIVIGSVYNDSQRPPYTLPDNATQSGIKSRSSKQGGKDNANEIRLEDKKGSEEIYIHAEKDMNVVVENSETRKVGFDKKDPGGQTIDIYKDRTVTLDQGNDKLQVKTGNRDVLIDTGNHTLKIAKGNETVQLDMGNCSLKIKMGNQDTKVDLGKSSTEAMQSIELKVGQSSVKIDQTGVTIKGMTIKIEGSVQTQVKGTMTQVNGDAMLTLKGGITTIN